MRWVSNPNQITSSNQVSFSWCKWSDLHHSALLLNWKLLKQEQRHWKQIESYFSPVLRGKKRHACREPHACTQTQLPCLSVFPSSSPTLSFLCVLFALYLQTKMSEWIRIIDSSPSTTVTDLADYFHAWQTLFSAPSSTVIEQDAVHMLEAMSCSRAWQWLQLLIHSHNSYETPTLCNLLHL